MNPYTKLAKLAVETFIKEKRGINIPKGTPKKLLKEKAGVFVSIHKDEQPRGIKPRGSEATLRGCIGTYLPTKENIAQEIISNAISAAQDSRFSPIQTKELPNLTYEVYILEKPEPIKNFDELNPEKYGILVQSSTSGKSGLLLPGLKGIDTKELQIFLACQKAGINPREEKIRICRFTAQKYNQ